MLRSRILDALRIAGGGWVSGEVLGRELNVSRAAVSKHIRALQSAGYIIESVTRRGYRLGMLSDSLAADAVVPLLKTASLGRGGYHYYETVGSTNDEAKRAAADGAPHGDFFVAETQTGGRGRRGRSWISPPGVGIYASVVLRPVLALHDVSLLSIAAALATADAVRSLTERDLRIKWPNDLLLNGRKVAGLLMEMSAEMQGIEYVVVGLGINVNTEIRDLPDDRCMYPASSLKQEIGGRVGRAGILADWLFGLERRVAELEKEGGGGLISEWETVSMPAGTLLRVSVDSGVVEGRLLGLREDGALRLGLDSGEECCLLSGDVLA